MRWRPNLSPSTSRSTERLPPGQRWVKGWPVLHEGSIPEFDPETWRLKVSGEVENPIELSWAEFSNLPTQTVTKDWHCVTTWSKKDNAWTGVSVSEILDRARPKPDAQFVTVRAYDEIGYTTNLSMSDFARPENLLCTHRNGDALDAKHGGPMRLIVHHLYAWKSAKWVTEIELRTHDERGFWETRGYHNHADPWLEERYSYQEQH